MIKCKFFKTYLTYLSLQLNVKGFSYKTKLIFDIMHVYINIGHNKVLFNYICSLILSN
jgi:hypothetical protein